MTESTFCLQAPGDSFTRRSTFDSVLAGCIPVFFSPHTAYTQYKWFLPEEVKTYSVYIDEKSPASRKIEDELLKISGEKVKAMREKLVDLIPSLTYAHPNATDVGFGDAVDVALASLANHVTKMMN
ncbi:putative xyloglucan galactosyltransferase GT17 [Prunus yedoensis var. nudiflora]|uniref:Putative xyloglucan galactosyltransferase GT17 n=1 Tax=Prunus yedoensis var. nudiflora TaxID=2094558 RepID=A0A314Z1P9_PRUYE|nr:putative xyloglucan galactosyltransferase GT17 [Prunus yedoensis var. nudiflora]